MKQMTSNDNELNFSTKKDFTMHNIAKSLLKAVVKRTSNTKHNIFRIATYILMIDLAYVFLFPFLYIIITSIKNTKDLHDFTVNWIPRVIEFKNYIIAFRALEYAKFFRNSFVMTAWTTVGHLLACSFIGYGFARYEFKTKKFFFSIAILSIIIPIQTIIIPQYLVFFNLNWIDTYLPMIVPTFFGFGLKGGLFIFIFRQFYLGLPTALEDAARIDGCGFLRTYWQIVLPVAKSSFVVVLVLSIVWHWNDFYEPSIYINALDKTMLPSRLKIIISMVNNPPDDFLIESGVISEAVLMAGTFLVVLPVIVVFAFLQKQFMQGIERTGLTE